MIQACCTAAVQPHHHADMNRFYLCVLAPGQRWVLAVCLCLHTAGNTCSIDRDGFYLVSSTMIVVGLSLGLLYMRLFPSLTRLPSHHWRAKH